MTDIELKELKDSLWHAADVLFKQNKEAIMSEYEKNKGGRISKTIKEISIKKCGFYLPECAYYDSINDTPDDANKVICERK